mmetsp:Transcript_21511/g.50150  ORF Transcript_21511/g.50150 Transcript_21511/m.50150 type:complete len:288 (-) Transcript_21511:173-1036(-)
MRIAASVIFEKFSTQSADAAACCSMDTINSSCHLWATSSAGRPASTEKGVPEVPVYSKSKRNSMLATEQSTVTRLLFPSFMLEDSIALRTGEAKFNMCACVVTSPLVASIVTSWLELSPRADSHSSRRELLMLTRSACAVKGLFLPITINNFRRSSDTVFQCSARFKSEIIFNTRAKSVTALWPSQTKLISVAGSFPPESFSNQRSCRYAVLPTLLPFLSGSAPHRSSHFAHSRVWLPLVGSYTVASTMACITVSPVSGLRWPRLKSPFAIDFTPSRSQVLMKSKSA